MAAAFQAGLALGPILGGILFSEGLEAGLFHASGVFAFNLLVAASILLCSAGDFKVKTGLRRPEGVLDGVRDYLKLGYLGVLVVWLSVLFTAFEGIVWAFEPLFGRHLGLNAFSAGVVLSMFVAPFIVFTVFAGVVADRYGRIRVLAPAVLASGLFLLLFGLSGGFLSLAALAFLSAAGLTFAWTSASGLLAEASKAHGKGGIVGVWNTAEELGYVLGPIAGGLVAQYSTFRAPFILLGVVMALTAALILSTSKRYLSHR